MMKSRIRRRAIVINGRKTSVSVEDAFWEPLKEIATARRTSVANVISLIEAHHQNTNRSSAIRVIVLEFYRDRKLPSWIRSDRHKSFPRSRSCRNASCSVRSDSDPGSKRAFLIAAKRAG